MARLLLLASSEIFVRRLRHSTLTWSPGRPSLVVGHLLRCKRGIEKSKEIFLYWTFFIEKKLKKINVSLVTAAKSNQEIHLRHWKISEKLKSSNLYQVQFLWFWRLWGNVPHTSAEKKIEIEAKSKKLSTFLSFHNTSDLAEYFGGKLWEWYNRDHFSPAPIWWLRPNSVFELLRISQIFLSKE